MPRLTVAVSEKRPVENLLWVLFIVGAVWSAHRISIFLFKVGPFSYRAPLYVEPVGAQWNEVRLFRSPASLKQWEDKQALLTRNLQSVLERTISLNYVFSVFPPVLLQPSHFDDFRVKPGLPLTGSVMKIEQGRQCVEFIWSKIPLEGVRYTLEIAKTRGFDFYRSFGVTNNRLRIQLSRKGDYFWRVRASSKRQNTMSDVASFLVLEPMLAPEAEARRDIALRIRQESAWLADLKFCR